MSHELDALHPTKKDGSKYPAPRKVLIHPDELEAVHISDEYAKGYGYNSEDMDPRITHLFFTTVEEGMSSYTHLAQEEEDGEHYWLIEHISPNGDRRQSRVPSQAGFSLYVGLEPEIPQDADEDKIRGTVTEVTAIAGNYLLQFLTPRIDTSTPEGPIPQSIRRFAVISGGRA